MDYQKLRILFGIFLVIAAILLSVSLPLVANAANNHYSSPAGMTKVPLQNLVSNSFGPKHSTHSGSSPFSISPVNLYRNEPAPMGLTDFGYSTAGGAYKYNSTSFLGTFDLQNLYTYNSSQHNNASAVQLNLMLNFTYGGASYTYWVQDVAALYTVSGGQTAYITMIDNVWNFSGSTSIYSSSLSGNGSVQSNTFYYAYASNGLQGNNVTLHAPVKIQLKEVSTTSPSGAPEVKMMYNDGYGWVTYDNIVFKFATSPTSYSGFVVSGYSYNKLGTYYDAEMIIGGPGGGTSTKFMSGSFNITLQYWNGQNYQYVPSAWDFGSDTAETISNAASSFYHSSGNVTVGSAFVPGSDTLGQVYSPSEVSDVNVSLPFSSGTMNINGIQYNFTNHGVNLTLFPGEYNISIYPSNGSKPLVGSFTIAAGETLQLDQNTFEKKYNVNVTENGLPPGTSWSVALANGTVYNTTTSQIMLFLANGTYTISPGTSGSYIYSGAPINLTVLGSNISVTANFSETFDVNFSQSGLNGIEWFVNLSGTIKYSLAGNITFSIVNGTYNYTILPIDGYHANPSYGMVTVNGSSPDINIIFSPVLYRVSINESGLPTGFDWSLFVNGNWHNSTNSSVVLELSNGTYDYSASAGGGSYTLSGSNYTFTVNGSNVTVHVLFKNHFNSGINLEYKLVFLALIAAISIMGAIALRRR